MKTKCSVVLVAAVVVTVALGCGTYADEPRVGDVTSANVRNMQGPGQTVVTCEVCKMHGIKDVDLARHQHALAKATGKQMCPNCAGLAVAAKFHKDGTIFQGEPDFVCSGCDKKRN